MRIGQRRDLRPKLGQELLVLVVQPFVLARLVVQECAGVRRSERYLNCVRVDLLGEADRLLDRLLGLAGQTENERAMDDDPELVAVLGKAAGGTAPAPPPSLCCGGRIARFGATPGG